MVHVGRDNQDVADRCDLLCLAVRPQVAQQVLSQLHLTSTHYILSFIATWNRERIAALMPEVKHIVRLAPLPMVAQAMGPTIIYPDDHVATELFASLGAAIPVKDEDAFDSLFRLACSLQAARNQRPAWRDAAGPRLQNPLLAPARSVRRQPDARRPMDWPPLPPPAAKHRADPDNTQVAGIGRSLSRPPT